MDKANQYGAWLRASNARSPIRKQNTISREERKVGEGPQLAKEGGQEAGTTMSALEASGGTC